MVGFNGFIDRKKVHMVKLLDVHLMGESTHGLDEMTRSRVRLIGFL